MCKSYLDVMTPKNITHAFKKCGTFPFNPNSIDDDWFKPSQVFQPCSTHSMEEFSYLLASKLLNHTTRKEKDLSVSIRV